jgi:hypothetical protein
MILTFFWKMKGMDMRGITDMTMVIATSKAMSMTTAKSTSRVTSVTMVIAINMMTAITMSIVKNMTTSKSTGIFRIYILSSTGWIPAAR